MIDVKNIETKIRSRVLPRVMLERRNIDRDEDLLEVFDSIDLLRLTQWLEKTFGIRIQNEELTAKNIGTLACLAQFVGHKLAPNLVCS